MQSCTVFGEKTLSHFVYLLPEGSEILVFQDVEKTGKVCIFEMDIGAVHVVMELINNVSFLFKHVPMATANVGLTRRRVSLINVNATSTRPAINV